MEIYNEVFSNIVNYPSEDVQNEVFSNIVNYPSEDVQNEVFSGQDGETTRKIDAQKASDTISSVGSAVGSVVGTVQAFQDPAKKEKRRELKDVCGRKPLLKKNRDEWNKCVSNYNAQIASASTRSASATTPVSVPPTPPANNNKKILLYVGIGAVVLVAGYMIYKKKFAKK